MEQQFNDMGIDAITGTEIMSLTGLTPYDIKNPSIFEKLKDSISYIKTLPPDQRSFFINKVVAGKNVNKLDHLWGYIELNKKRDAKLKEMEQFKQELSFYETLPKDEQDTFRTGENTLESKGYIIMKELTQIKQELSFYEK